MDPSADEDDDGKTRPYEGYNYTRCRNVVKLVKPDDKDADEKARAARPDAFTVVHSFYIRGRPDEEAQPAKKPVKPDDKDADEKARAARPDAFTVVHSFYIRGRPDEEAQPAKKPVKPDDKDADEKGPCSPPGCIRRWQTILHTWGTSPTGQETREARRKGCG